MNSVERTILTGGKPHLVLVDECDVSLLDGRKWVVFRSGNTFYLQAKFDGKKRLLHRLIVGAEAGYVVDHINRNGLDNRRENLRLATTQQNACNRVKGNFLGAQSKFKGVYKKYPTRWAAQISVNNEIKHLGYFSSDVDAARSYDLAARAAFGEFARLNFPEEAAV